MDGGFVSSRRTCSERGLLVGTVMLDVGMGGVRGRGVVGWDKSGLAGHGVVMLEGECGEWESFVGTT